MNDAFYDALALWSQVLGSIAFLIVIVILFQRFVIPAIVASQERKNAELADAERRRDVARADVEVARKESEDADGTATAIRERAARDAERERFRIVTEATAEGERLIRNAQGEPERARAQARERLRGDLLERALRIAREAAANVDAPTNARLVGSVIDEIERGGSA